VDIQTVAQLTPLMAFHQMHYLLLPLCTEQNEFYLPNELTNINNEKQKMAGYQKGKLPTEAGRPKHCL